MTRNLRILVAEDEDQLLTMFVSFLGEICNKVKGVENGKMALQELRSHSYDVLISDLQMPEMSGGTLLEMIEKENIHVKTIVITGNPTLIDESIKIRSEGILYKPFLLEDLKDMLTALCGKSLNDTNSLSIDETDSNETSPKRLELL